MPINNSHLAVPLAMKGMSRIDDDIASGVLIIYGWHHYEWLKQTSLNQGEVPIWRWCSSLMTIQTFNSVMWCPQSNGCIILIANQIYKVKVHITIVMNYPAMEQTFQEAEKLLTNSRSCFKIPRG